MSFDHLAPHYHRMERLFAGRLMQRCRTAFLTQAAYCRNALLVGEGPGDFLIALLRANPCIRVTCWERSSSMIREARRRLQRERLNEDRITFVQQDILTGPWPEFEFDLVATHFFLDCFTAGQTNWLVARLGRAAAKNATWLLSDFQLPRKGWRRWRASGIVCLLYTFFRCTTDISATALAPPAPWLQEAGFILNKRLEWSAGLLYSELWQR